MLAPKVFGGAETPPTQLLAIYEAISEADAATAWVLMASNVCIGTTSGYLATDIARDIFRSHIPIIAGVGAPMGRADVVDRGFRLSGRWKYGSGVLHSEWIHCGAAVFENGQRRMHEGRPEVRTFVVPSGEAVFLGNWDTLGLRATGSVDFSLKEVFVPLEFTHFPSARHCPHGGSLYRLGVGGFAACGHAAVAMGIARRVLDELRQVVTGEGTKPRALSNSGGNESFHEQYALAEGKLRAGRAFCYEVFGEVEERLASERPVTTRDFTLMRLALSHVTSAAAEICAFAHKAASGTSLRSGVLQRYFRDMYSATQHQIVSGFILSECGRELLGRAEGESWTNQGLV